MPEETKKEIVVKSLDEITVPRAPATTEEWTAVRNSLIPLLEAAVRLHIKTGKRGAPAFPLSRLWSEKFRGFFSADFVTTTYKRLSGSSSVPRGNSGGARNTLDEKTLAKIKEIFQRLAADKSKIIGGVLTINAIKLVAELGKAGFKLNSSTLVHRLTRLHKELGFRFKLSITSKYANRDGN